MAGGREPLPYAAGLALSCSGATVGRDVILVLGRNLVSSRLLAGGGDQGRGLPVNAVREDVRARARRSLPMIEWGDTDADLVSKTRLRLGELIFSLLVGFAGVAGLVALIVWLD
jgi:hypothetical protein